MGANGGDDVLFLKVELVEGREGGARGSGTHSVRKFRNLDLVVAIDGGVGYDNSGGVKVNIFRRWGSWFRIILDQLMEGTSLDL